MSQSGASEVSLELSEGWHCSHLYYRFDRARLPTMNPAQICRRARAGDRTCSIRPVPSAPARLQVSIVSGHKADFGLMLLDANPLKIDAVHQRLMASPLGRGARADLFVRLAHRSLGIRADGRAVRQAAGRGRRATRQARPTRPSSRPTKTAKAMMRRQRLTPDLPPWPSTCFYPMNKKRKVGENWFLLPFAERSRLMAEHGRTGMTFGGKVTQLITASDRLRRLGMGRHAVGPQPAVPQRHRLPHAVRRSQRPLRRVRPVLRQLRDDRRPRCSITAASPLTASR